jgi:predicted dehydrogenase
MSAPGDDNDEVISVNRVDLAVAGAGIRGTTYAMHAVATGRAAVVAVAEPDPARRDAFAERFGVPPERRFATWEALAAQPKLADAVVVATQDRMHVEPAVAFAGLGYHLLLEKPMAPTEEESRRITEAVLRAGVICAVCHVLRYTPYTKALKQVLDSGVLGRLVSVQHLEPVGWWHQAHSFVRGNWRRTDESGPMLLTKSCHDLDWLNYLVGAEPAVVSSFGGLAHFHAGDRPAGAGSRCLECGVEPDCPYSAKRLYLGMVGDPKRQEWPLPALTGDLSREGVEEALRTGPYGRCVYDCDNDVVDHQIVALQYANGVTATFTMTAFTGQGHRQTRLFGTHGCIDGDGDVLRVTNFRDGGIETVTTDSAGAHGGGDQGLVDAFVSAVASGDGGLLSSDVVTSLAGHRVVWAAERARLTGTVVTLT